MDNNKEIEKRFTEIIGVKPDLLEAFTVFNHRSYLIYNFLMNGKWYTAGGPEVFDLLINYVTASTIFYDGRSKYPCDKFNDFEYLRFLARDLINSDFKEIKDIIDRMDKFKGEVNSSNHDKIITQNDIDYRKHHSLAVGKICLELYKEWYESIRGTQSYIDRELSYEEKTINEIHINDGGWLIELMGLVHDLFKFNVHHADLAADFFMSVFDAPYGWGELLSGFSPVADTIKEAIRYHNIKGLERINPYYKILCDADILSKLTFQSVKLSQEFYQENKNRKKWDLNKIYEHKKSKYGYQSHMTPCEVFRNVRDRLLNDTSKKLILNNITI